MRTWGTELRERRLRARKTLGELARHMGYTLTYLSDVERNTQPPPNETQIRKMCAFLGIDPLALLTTERESRV